MHPLHFPHAAARRTSILCAVLLSATSVHAAESWGTKAEAFNLNCTSTDCSGGGVSGGDSIFEPDVVNFQGSPATNNVDGSLGTATVTASFEADGSGLATMRQTGEATGAINGIAFSEGNTLDFVTYNGPPATVTISIDLTGTHTGPTSGADNSLDGINGVVHVFRDQNAIDSIDSEMSTDLSCLFECYVPDETSNVTVEDGNLADSDTIVLDLADGDTFYIYGRLNLTGAGGGVASSLNSFTYSFSPSAGLTSLAGGGAGPVDTDGDGVPDAADNCTMVSNVNQIDADGDGYGNVCDADINNDNIVNTADLGLLRLVFFSADAIADFNTDGVVNLVDLGIMRAGFFQPPGPSAFAP
ncbi:MAG: thrombospondin type 3 repeat-containing protein [Gammaproteobacteria bacterium]